MFRFCHVVMVGWMCTCCYRAIQQNECSKKCRLILAKGTRFSVLNERCMAIVVSISVACAPMTSENVSVEMVEMGKSFSCENP